MNIFVEIPQGTVRDTFLTKENKALLEKVGTVTWNESSRHCTAEEFAEALIDKDVCVCAWGVPAFDENVLRKATHLKLVAYTCGSVYHIANDELFRRGIRILSGNDAFAESVAEGTLAYIEAALRHIPQCVENFRQNGWPDGSYMPTASLLDQTVGLIGFGTISRYMIALLKPFRARIKVFSNHADSAELLALGAEKASLEEICSTCKIISVHCARSKRNFHLIDDRLMALMRSDALLVNTARGDIIDEAALIRYLNADRFSAILDVYEEEPLPPDNPLFRAKNVILMPHRGGPTTDRRAVAARLVIEDIIRLKENKPLQNEISGERALQMTCDIGVPYRK